MRLSLQQIETFYWAARLGGFHAAARHQHLTQPTISARIQELEAQLGVKLFDRERARSGLTLIGHEALAQAEQILNLADKFSRLAEISDPMRGLLRVGVNESVAMFGLSEILTQVKARYPDLHIEITVDVGAHLSRKMAARELDIAVHNNPSNVRHVVERIIGTSNLHWVASPALVSGHAVAPEQLATLPVITVSEPSTNHALVMKWFHDVGVVCRNVSSCNSLSTMLQLVAGGHGVAVMSSAFLSQPLSAGEVRTLNLKQKLKQEKFLVAYQEERSGEGVDWMVGMIEEVLKKSAVVL